MKYFKSHGYRVIAVLLMWMTSGTALAISQYAEKDFLGAWTSVLYSHGGDIDAKMVETLSLNPDNTYVDKTVFEHSNHNTQDAYVIAYGKWHMVGNALSFNEERVECSKNFIVFGDFFPRGQYEYSINSLSVNTLVLGLGDGDTTTFHRS